MFAWDRIVDLIWGDKAQSWLGTWGFASWIHCISSEGEYLQGPESSLTFCLPMWQPGQEQLHPQPRNFFQQLYHPF